MKARYIGENIGCQASLEQAGDVGIGAANYHFSLLARCPICFDLHIAPLDPKSYPSVWQWNESTITLQPSLRTEGPRGVCHWSLIKGVFTIWPDSTAKGVA